MARVHGQAVPPSLIEVYQDTIKNGTPSVGTHVLASANPTARTARQQKDQTPLANFASNTATWLTDRWLKSADRGSRSSFYRARRAEIMAGNFDASFWAAGVMFSDTTELCVPAVYPYTGTWNPTYWDDIRKPTRCEYRDISMTYPTPEGEGTGEEPAPGWRGAVINTEWRDLYHAQRRITFELQHGITAGDGRPVAIMLDWAIDAEATIRGNKNWFTLIVHPIFHIADHQHSTQKAACARWAREDQYRKSIPGDAVGGWEYSANHRTARDGRKFAEFGSDQACNRLSLRIASAPSLGIYGSRNDEVAVRNSGNAMVYTAK